MSGNGGRVPLGPGGEFDLIRKLLGPASDLAPGVLLGPGDDCAVLEGGWVVSTDLFLEGIHFKRDWITLEEAGFRATAAALSDLAAMAARPVGVLLSLTIPSAPDSVLLQRGAAEACERSGAQILGGDLSGSFGPTLVNVVALGRADSPFTRGGTEVGDEIWVTGWLGGSAGAVSCWNRGTEPPEALRESFARPTPRIREALWLADRVDIHGLIDLSDGLAGDAGHLAAAAGRRLVLERESIPVHPMLPGVEGSPEGALRLALEGGEDFELAFSVPNGTLDEWRDSFQDTFGIPLSRVGSAEEGRGVALRDSEGGLRPVAGRGFSHFPAEEEG